MPVSSATNSIEALSGEALKDVVKRFVVSLPGYEVDVPLRVALESLATTLAEDFDNLWNKSLEAAPGPIDVVDFFSGCGGMSAGFRAVNALVPAYRNILAVDLDQSANATYAANLGLDPVAIDVAKLAEDLSLVEALMDKTARNPENPLVVIGCAPCQGFSSHRNTAGADDKRNGLFIDFARIAAHLDPDFIVIENVPEICTDRYWNHIEHAREIFEKNGFSTHLAVHNMAEFGLPQERFRAVMLAAKKPFTPPTGYLTHANYRTVRDAIGNLPPVAAGECAATDNMHQSANHRERTIEMIRSVPKDGGNRNPGSGPASLAALGQRQGKPAYEDVYGRLFWDRPSITITHYSRNPASGRFVHPEQDRGLTVREAALLQGFPSSYAFYGGFDEKFSQVGNAVPPVVASYLGLWVLGQILDPPQVGPEPGVMNPLAKSFSRLIPGLKARARRTAPSRNTHT